MEARLDSLGPGDCIHAWLALEFGARSGAPPQEKSTMVVSPAGPTHRTGTLACMGLKTVPAVAFLVLDHFDLYQA
jgi:hypothetical protein